MPNRNILQVSEYEKLYYDDKKPFKQKHWEALCRYLDNQNKKEEKRVEYFRILNKGIQFTNFVGVIQAGNLTIEILPKIDKGATTAANKTLSELQQTDEQAAKEKAKWHKVLLQMLKECRLLKVNQVDYANLNLRSNSILDIYIDLFLIETEKLLHEGLHKKYQKQEGNQTALKGQLQFAKQIAHNITHQERFYVRFTEYNRNNIYNCILYKTLCLIPGISNNNYFSDKVGRLLLDFPEVANVNINEETFTHPSFDRKTERYKEALLISKMLLLNYHPDITGGQDNVIAILFDMNKLWEEFIYRRLKKEEENFDIKVYARQSTNFWKPENGSLSKKIKPDIVISKNEKVKSLGIAHNGTRTTFIIDTKWKCLDDLNPNDADLKQMFVYNLFWKCDMSILLYPAQSSASAKGIYHSHLLENEMDTCCSVEVITVIDKNGLLDKEIGGKILTIVLPTALHEN